MNKSAVGLAGAMQVNTAADFSESGSLFEGQVAVIRKPRGRRILCTQGQLWVTVEGDPADHVLEARQSIVLGGRGLAVVSGSGGSAYLLD
jgi:hypothetical protein